MLLGTPAQALQVIPDSYREGWLALLHYTASGASRSSEVTDPSFFLTVDGARDAEHEWIADRDAFLLQAGHGPTKDHAQCKFPARFAFMKEALGWTDATVPRVACREFDSFRLRLHASTLAVVFVSHYLNNPSSAFGHTMLYLGSGSARTASKLTDYSVSFDADVSGMSAVGYMKRGLTGGLVAGYRVEPLYLRVRKYERLEQRDLQLFPLRVTQAEIDQLVRHLWEVDGLRYEYGFLQGNCAQKILSLVNAIAPTLALLPYRRVAVLPSEVSRRLVDRIGIAGEPSRRPSLWNRYSRQLASLSQSEKDQVRAMEKNRAVLPDATPLSLSTALLWSEFNVPYRAFQRASDTTDHRDLLWRRNLWKALVAADSSRKDIDAVAFAAADGPSVLQSHRPSRISTYGGYTSRTGAAVGFDVRWLLHSAIDPVPGYPSFSSLEVARLDLAVNASHKIEVNELTALRLEHLAPTSELQSHIAWKLDVGARRLAFGGASSLHLGAEIGIGEGASVARGGYELAVYSMVGLRPGVTVVRGRTSFLPVGLSSSGLLLRTPSDIRTRITTEYLIDPRVRKRGTWSSRADTRKLLTQTLELEARVSTGAPGLGVSLGLAYYR